MGHSVQEYQSKFAVLNDLDIIALVEVALSDDRLKPYENLTISMVGQIDVAGPGTIELMLDEIAGNDAAKRRFVDVLRDVKGVVAAMGERAPIRVSNKYGMGATFEGYPTDRILTVVDQLTDLVTAPTLRPSPEH